MRKPVEIENIEALRYREGIDDVELREEIRGLGVGDFVNLTFLIGTPARGETVLVRITAIEGRTYSGQLTRRPTFAGLSTMRAGARVAFTSAHIHSLPKDRPPHEP